MLISGVKCDQCGRTDIMDYENDDTIKILFSTKGWKINKNNTLCPFCKIKELANNYK